MQGGAPGPTPIDGSSTRIERRPKLLPAVDLLQQPVRAQLPSEDIDIPIDVVAEDEPAAAAAAAGALVEFEDPTEVWRPGMALPPPSKHQRRPQPPAQQAGTSTRLSPMDAEQVARIRKQRVQQQPQQPIEDWDGETMVKRPDADSPPSRQPPPPRHQPPAAKPFNPEETLRLDTTGDIELERHRGRRR